MIIFSTVTHPILDLVIHVKTKSFYKGFDANPSLEVRVVFLDLPKVFDKVWHDGLL